MPLKAAEATPSARRPHKAAAAAAAVPFLHALRTSTVPASSSALGPSASAAAMLPIVAAVSSMRAFIAS